MRNNLALLRNQKHVTQEEVAKATGISQQMISMMEKGIRRGSDLNKQKLADYFKTDVGSIFFTSKITNRDNKNTLKEN